MAPAANTAKQRRVPGSKMPADSDSDAEYQAYNGRLREASAARSRLRKAKQTRDQNRTALAAAYDASLQAIEARVRAAVTKHNHLRSAKHIAQLKRLRQALERRDATLGQIAQKLAEQRRRMLNLAVQLQALYEGRRDEVGELIREAGWDGDGVGAGGDGGGGGEGPLRVDRALAERVSALDGDDGGRRAVAGGGKGE